MENLIDIEASEQFFGTLADLGRTEDIKFSPNNERLAIACFHANAIVVIELLAGLAANESKVQIGEWIQIVSPVLDQPHGVTFLDSNTIAVANRGASVEIFDLSDITGARGRHSCSPIRTIRDTGKAPMKSPGSVSSFHLGDGLYEILVCNNYVNMVNRYVVDSMDACRVIESDVLLRKLLDVPDGVAVSSENQWIAVSNHNTKCVLLYDHANPLNIMSLPSGLLRDLEYPHGICFSDDQKWIMVADAGEPCIKFYASGDNGWHGMHEPVYSLQAVSDAAFAAGHYSEEEGGPKGIDLAAGSRVLAVTCEHQPLAFFDLSEIFDGHGVSAQAAKA